MELNISLAPQVLFNVAGFPVTNAFLWMFFISLFLIAFFILIANNMKTIPGKVQNAVEIFFESAWDFMKTTVGSEEKTKKMFPLVFTIFVFVLLSNLFTFIPGQAAVVMAKGGEKISVFRSVMSDYGIVFLMTIIAIIIVQIVAIAVNGPFAYLGKFFNFSGVKRFFTLLFKGEFKPAVFAQGLVDIFLGFMEIVSEFAKVLSMSFRLFGNMFASEVLGAVMLFLAPFFLPLPFLFLGLLTAIVQAFVFAVLTMVFIHMASEVEAEAG